MRRYLLDSTPLAAYLLGRKLAVDFISSLILDQEAATSQLVYAEIIEYIRGFSNYARHKKALRSTLDEVYPYYLTYPILERYADIRRSLRPPFGKGLIGDIDTYDRGKKFSYYRACPTVQEYVIVATRCQTVEIYSRTAESWAYDAYGPDDVIEITSLDIRIPVAALYRNAGVPEGVDDPDGEV